MHVCDVVAENSQACRSMIGQHVREVRTSEGALDLSVGKELLEISNRLFETLLE
jgi:hypothetical protein